MTLRADDLVISAKLPQIGKEMPVFKVRSARLEEREDAVEVFRHQLELGRLSTIEIEDSIHFASKRGEVQFYRPSGAVWARNVLAAKSYENEIRPWKEVEEVAEDEEEDVRMLRLSDSVQKQLVAQAQDAMAKAGLSAKQAFLAGVELEQVAELDEKGKQVGLYPGEATVRYLYKLEDVIVDGAGAKSYIYYDPSDGGGEMIGAFHAWRDVVDSKAVATLSVDELLDTVLAKDKEFDSYHERGQRIELTAVDLVYYSLPAFAFQELVFPALRVVGSVLEGSERDEQEKEAFEFARYFHAATPTDYAKADLYAKYLSTGL